MMAWDTAKQISNLRVIYKAARNTGMGSLMLVGKHGDVNDRNSQGVSAFIALHGAGPHEQYPWRGPMKGTCCTRFCSYIISYVIKPSSLAKIWPLSSKAPLASFLVSSVWHSKFPSPPKKPIIQPSTNSIYILQTPIKTDPSSHVYPASTVPVFTFKR